MAGRYVRSSSAEETLFERTQENIIFTVFKPTTREVFGSTLGGVSEQDALEREFFARVMLPNGTIKTTGADRMDDLNAAVFPYIAAITERPVKVMDVGVIFS